ncbi:EAL domain-containing protein [Marinomonas algicola]|uniref:EAL domain-containing protein n=1 Tax=Marinomonas algicola TaxID=2773454 RepID=UPI0017495B6F|nr:EAL domain-containing protein [Marinomonas algicola]
MIYSPLMIGSSSLSRFYKTIATSLSYYFFFILFCWGVFSLWETQRELENRSHYAALIIERFLTSHKDELASLIVDPTESCNGSTVDFLRKKTFQSPYAKELSLIKYNEDKQLSVFCTNMGEMDILIWKTIQKRLEKNSENFTISYTEAKLTGEPSLFGFYLNGRGYGSNSVMPSGLLIKEILSELKNDVVFRFHIGKKLLYSSPVLLDIGTDPIERSDGIWSASTHQFLNKEIRLESAITTDYLIGRLWSNSILFLFIWIACASVTQLVLLWYREYFHSFRRYLKVAIENHEMELHYQPIIDVLNKKTLKVEALLRWNSERFGYVSPILVVEKAIEYSLMVNLTNMVFAKAVQFVLRNDKNCADIMVNINIDRESFLNVDFINQVVVTMEANPALIGRIGFEVTENNGFNDEEMKVALTQFQRLKRCGIGLSIDDFGTGYSGLDFLRQFPFEVLKIDKVFIQNLSNDKVTTQILEHVITLAQELDMALVAEGVETEEQLSLVTAMGIHCIQGYYFSKPLPEERILEWLVNQGRDLKTVALS